MSYYTIKEFKDGFTITGEDRIPTTMRITQNGLGFSISSTQRGEVAEGIPELHMIIHRLAGNLMDGWVSPKETDLWTAGWDITSWVRTQTKKALASRVKKQWLRLKEQMNPDVIAIQNRVFSVNLQVPDWMLETPEFYRHKYIIGDIMKYRGASAVACRMEDTVQGYFTYNDRPEEPWRLLEDWMSLYSPERKTYPALRKTLMNLPGNFPPGPLQALRHIILPERVTDYYKLLALTVLGQEAQHMEEEKFFRYRPVILRSTEEAFKEMITLVGKNFEWNAGPRTFKRFRSSLVTVMDYPGEFGPIDIMGLTRRSMIYHTDERERTRLNARKRAMEGLEPEDKTARPPVPLLVDKHIRFLETVEEVVDEGDIMDHCVGSYAGYAVKGKSFLFHVEYKGSMATIEVHNTGDVNQAHGERNKHNKAVTYGRKELQKWGATFPHVEREVFATLPVAADIPF